MEHPYYPGAKVNDGRIVGFLTIDQQNLGSGPILNIIDLTENCIAIMGKNGTGKTSVLKRMADSVLQSVSFQHGGVNNKYWDGGFVFSPNGAKNDVFEIFGSEDKETLFGLNNKLTSYTFKRQINIENSDEVTLDHKLVSQLNFSEIFPSPLSFSKQIKSENIEWNPYYYIDLAEELVKANLFVYMMHPFASSQGIHAFDEIFKPEPIIVRAIEINESTPFANILRDRIRMRLEYICNVDKESLRSLYRELAFGGNSDDQMDKNPLFTPYILPWRLLEEDFSWIHKPDDKEELSEFLKTFSKTLSSTLIEWPQDRFQASAEKLFAVAADPHLVEDADKSQLNEWTLLTSSTTKIDWFSYFKKEEVERGWKLLNDRVTEILEEWNVIPTWERISSLNGDRVVYGRDFDLKLGNLKSYFDSPINETTKRWVYRAYQVAILEKSVSPYRLLLWDEPELGLHPTAVQDIYKKIFPWLTSRGYKIIFTTHSALLGNNAESLFLSQRQSNWGGTPYLIKTPNLSQDLLDEIGLLKTDLLSSIRNFVVVEGDHDRIVLETAIGNELEKTKSKILTMRGTDNLLTLPESEILYEFLDSKIIIVLDGKKRATLNQYSDDLLEKLNEALMNNNLQKSEKIINEIQSVIEKRKVPEGFEIYEAVALLRNAVSLAASGVLDISRIRLFMFEESDVIHYLDPKLVLKGLDASRNWDWKSLRSLYQSKKAKDQSEKMFYRQYLKVRITNQTVRVAATALLDRALPIEFEALELLLK